ncbi:HAMP domain-containing sensor histidine kinase [Falsirhodobacter sp. 1013]|uniref:HAMP domain-containing sensor histidine kinase n=1 Tax=Falsirhodobacter sp. 1013 TaxID=3417566 RepID=UPI003EB9623A
MPKLFRKFLTIIWLTVVGSITVMTLILFQLQAWPVFAKLELQKRDVVLSLAETLLRNEGEVAARQFAFASQGAVSLDLSITTRLNPGDCAGSPTATTRYVRQEANCYRISVAPYAGTAWGKFAPIMLGLAIMLSSLLAAILLARYLIRPVALLRDGLSALAQGHFDTRIAERMVCRRDEIAALGHDLDITAMRLQEHRDAQQRLFHDVSHELRSPLSRLQAAVGILRKTPTRLTVMLDRMDREVERLDVLVGEVLTLARLTTRSGSPLSTQQMDIIEILNDILDDAAFEAQPTGTKISSNLKGSFIAQVNGELIYRALENVIRNAIKYTAERTFISVSCEITGDLLTVRVSDQGPGVAPADLERIFQPFTRGEGIPRGGYGLGLAIARQGIESHGGQVYASLQEGAGLTITLRIPRTPHRSASANTSAAM